MPSAKKERSRKQKKKSPKRAVSPAVVAATARIEAANAIPDLSKGMEAFLSIDLPAVKSSGLFAGSSSGAVSSLTNPPATTDPVRLEIRQPETLATGDAQVIYDLLKDNMHDMYVEAGWGWDEAEKWRDMEHRNARFLIGRCGSCGSGSSGGGGDGGPEKEKQEVEVEKVTGTTEASLLSSPLSSSLSSPLSSPLSKERQGRREEEGGADNSSDAGPDGKSEGRGRRGGSSFGGHNGKSNDPAAARAITTGTEDGLLAMNHGKPEGEYNGVAGFCHFRFAWDQDEDEDGEGVGGTNDVLYVYELQVAPWAKRRGLGRRMMQALELLANRHGMSKVMLTVFKENKQAMSFYTKKMKYGVDGDSPSNWDQPDEVYEILSKPTRQGAARAKEARLSATLLN